MREYRDFTLRHNKLIEATQSHARRAPCLKLLLAAIRNYIAQFYRGVRAVHSVQCTVYVRFNDRANRCSSLFRFSRYAGRSYYDKVRIDYRWQVRGTCSRVLSERAITLRSIAPRGPR